MLRGFFSKRWFAIGLLTVTGLALGVGPACAQDEGPGPVDSGPVAETRPDWAALPSYKDVVTPPDLGIYGLEGHALLDCLITVEGRATDCRVVEESPQNLGVGKAALASAAGYRFKPATRNGAPVEVRIKVPQVYPMPADMRPGESAVGRPARRDLDICLALALDDVLLEPTASNRRLAAVWQAMSLDQTLTAGRLKTEAAFQAIELAIAEGERLRQSPDRARTRRTCLALLRAMHSPPEQRGIDP